MRETKDDDIDDNDGNRWWKVTALADRSVKQSPQIPGKA